MSTVPDPSKANILIVDDRPENRLVLQTILGELGENIVAVNSGEAALKQLLDRDFAVILLDVNMPGMDGLETAAYVRRRPKTAHTPIIFLTAYAEEMNAAYSLGAVDYMLTPVVPDVLRTKVKVFVQLYQMNQQAQREAEQRIALAREQAARAAAEDSTRRSSFLAAASHLLINSLDVNITARALTRFVVPALAEMSALMLTDEQGSVRSTEICWSSGTERVEYCQRSALQFQDEFIVKAIERALTSDEVEIIGRLAAMPTELRVLESEVAEPARIELGFALHAVAVLPLSARGHKLGALLLGLSTERRDLSRAELALAEDIAARTAVSLDNCMLYAKIQEADQRKNEFLAMLAHELRNPLAPIRNAVHILCNAGLDRQKLDWASTVIDRQTQQLVRLVDDLLDVARITQGRIQLSIAPVGVAAVVALAMETSRPLIESRAHELTIDIPDEPLVVLGDAARIAQIIANIVNNAAKYTEPGGRITISVRPDSANVVFRIKDTGIGISKDMIGSIFDLFTQSDRSLDRSQGGLGIGLTVAQRLARMQGGNVRAYSAGSGLGSEFVVRLPRVMSESTQAPDPEAHAATTQRHSVLIVDDYVDAAETMASLLEVQGHTVRVAHDGPAAIEMARSFKPNIVFLDIGLPNMNGFDVATHLRAASETRDCVLVAMTGYGQPEDYQRSKAHGFDHHFVKPVDPSMLTKLFSSLPAGRDLSDSSH